MKDIIIGDVNEKLCSAVSVGINRVDVSKNRDDYWVGIKLLEVRMKISKEHKVGKKLTDLIDRNAKWFEIEEFLFEVAKPLITVKDMKMLIENEKVKSFENGEAAAQKVMRRALGIFQ